MRGRSVWLVLALLCLAGGLWLLRSGHAPVRPAAPGPQAPSPTGTSVKARAPAVPGHPGTIAATPSSSANTVTPGQHLAYHLSNTTKTGQELLRNDHAILLANADIDTTLPLGGLKIPDDLKAPADTQNWIVQANGPLNAQFRALLASAGAQVVSYIPNNAELIVAPANVAQGLAASPLVAAVLPYEPYYKLTDPALLKLAVTGEDLPADVGLRLGLFPGTQNATLAALKGLGAEVVGSEPSPFGPVLNVHLAPGTFINVANFPGVMAVEAIHRRGAANDLTRQRLNVSVNTVTNNDYLSLSGLGVFVNVNDSGVDQTHPDLNGRITLDPGGVGVNPTASTDPNSHGTHVIGTILGSGSESSLVVPPASGSVTNASYRGMATNAQAYVIALDAMDARPEGIAGIPPSDAYLQETAGRTNVFISNNSWDYDGDAQYDMAAASYDAAVRDAVPEVTGPQPLLYVFAAGNDGGGGTDGTAGIADTVLSPATAKNVITVGSIEQLRKITNEYVVGGVTNQAWLVETDSSNQVSDFSSRGNVGVGIEGQFGRFKPDVVAPGTFVVSDKSRQWDQAEYYNPTNFTFNTLFNQSVTNNSLEPYSIVIPANAVAFSFIVVTNDFSPSPFPSLPVYIRYDDNPTMTTFDATGINTVTVTPPALPVGQRIFFSVGNTTNGFVSYDLVTLVETTNDNGNLLTVLSNMNQALGPYRYESGTSMAAASVSGTLALMQEFLVSRLHLSAPSPALFKALLINGARTVGSQYDFNVTGAVTSAGWGLPSLPNSIPGALTNGGSSVPMEFFDQSTNMVATGQTVTWKLKLANGQTTQPLRITLVWTDPPGNPAAGVKLVNDLDLVVTNTDNGSVFYGNDIPAGSDYNVAHAATNNVPNPDSVNNVENVYLFPPLNTNYSITVYGHRVNVNAVDANTSNVVQDFALVASYGDAGTVSNAFTMTPATLVSSNTPTLGTITNGLPLLNQRVGGNAQFFQNWSTPGGTNGVTNQWQFYVFTNTASLTNAAFTNVAFVTYDPLNLGVPRMGTREEADPANGVRTEADIDLYVSTDPTLTNLLPATVAAAFKSQTRTGTEKVLLSNQPQGQVYYVGVKSEDQQGAQYALVGVALTNSFGQVDSNGNVTLTIIAPALPTPIPTGTAPHPGSVTVLALTTVDLQARKVVVADTIAHQQFGDLVGVIGHGTKTVVLNNHSFFVNPSDTVETFAYDDTGEIDDPYVYTPTPIPPYNAVGWHAPFNQMIPQPNTAGPRHTDGPGSLTTFAADNMSDGIWTVSMVNDSSPFDTGFINNLNIFVEPQQPSNGVVTTIAQNSWFYDFINVPANATNLTITVAGQTTGNGVDLYIRRGAFPDFSDFDKFVFIPSGGGQLSLGLFDDPPLNPGTYFIGVFNPNPVPVTVSLHWTFGLSLAGPQPYVVVSPGNEPIPDDAVMDSTNFVGISSHVVSAEVGVRINHPRESDLVLTLVSPAGTRVLLAENRGGLDTNGFGSGQNITNSIAPVTAGTFTPTNTVIPVGTNSGTLLINYDFFQIADDMRVYYGNTRIFDSGLINGAGTFSVDFGPGTSNSVTIAMNEPGTNPNGTNGDAWQYQVTEITKNTTYVWFTEDTNKTTTPIKFAVPPFGAGAAFTTATTNTISTFEGVLPGDYAGGGPLIDGWAVMNTNPVKVVSVNVLAANESNAIAGQNVLALHNGSIQTVLPTIIGKSYTLSFMAHGRPVANNPAGWWKAELNTVDSSGNNNNGTGASSLSYAPGEVGDAFNFAGGGQNLTAIGSATLNVAVDGGLTIEGWIWPIDTVSNEPLAEWNDNLNLSGPACNQNLGPHFWINQPAVSDGGGPLSLFANMVDTTTTWHTIASGPNVLVTNGFQHVAVTYDVTSGNTSLYVNGTVVGTSNFPGLSLQTGSLYNFYLGHRPPSGCYPSQDYRGLMDETAVYGSALSQLQIQDVYAAGSAGKLPVGMDGVQVAAYAVLSGVTNTFNAGDQWTNISITFTAPSNNMVLQIQSINTNNNGMLVDSFQLINNPSPNTNNYFLPEETLNTLQGQNAQGNWKLEVLDNRLGATNPPPLLASWELSLGLERVNPAAFVLVEGTPVTNTVQPGFIAYYVVNVPIWATQATNILTVSSGGPVNFLFNQSFLPGLTNGDVTLIPNTLVGGTVTLNTAGVPPPPLLPGQSYYLAVTNSGTTPATVTLQVNFDITVLTDSVPLLSTIAPISTQPRYFQFNVPPVPPAAVAYLLYNMTGNADLVVSKGFPLPTLTSQNYISANPGTNSEFISVTPGSAPVPLSPGPWYLGVYNNDTNTVTYTVEAASLTPNVIVLTNDERLTMTNVSPLAALETFFSFNITTAPPGALFEVYRMTGDVDLTLNPVNVLPFGGPIFQSSANPGTNDEQIVIRTTTTGPNPLNGTWYLAVPSQAPGNVNYTIHAVVTGTNGLLVSGVPIAPVVTLPVSPTTGGPTLTWYAVNGECYEVDSSPDLINWTPLPIFPNPITAAGSMISVTDPNPLAGVPMTFYRIIQVQCP